MIHLVMFKQKKENCWYGFHYDLLRMKHNTVLQVRKKKTLYKEQDFKQIFVEFSPCVC